MPRDYAAFALNEVRRADREVKDELWIRALHETAPLGFLATSHQHQPFINSNIFAYDAAQHAIYMHTANVGRTQANVALNDRVCFTVASMGRLLPADQALEFSVEYASVVVFGRMTPIEDPTKAEYGLQKILDKYAPHLRPGKDYRPITSGELQRTGVLRIDIEAWSGKKKEVEADFPGAYLYGMSGTESA